MTLRKMTGAMIGQTRSWLRAKSVLVPEDWLEACVEWIKEENQGNNIVQSRINDLVFEQWLLADLHELGTRCLPNGLAEVAKYQLSGTYALQIDSMVDVGKSFYSQLQKVQGNTNSNAEVSAETSDQKPWEPKPSQMMMLNLTDGTNNIKGMEYKPLTCINNNLQPGTKVIVSGSVLCRRGVLFLTNNNLQVLGGEVDTLMEENTKVKLLQDALDSSMHNAGSVHRQEFSDTDIKPSQSSVRNSTLAPNNRGGSASMNRNPAMPGGNSRPSSSIKPLVEDAVLDEWDMEDLPMDEMMDELDGMDMPQPGHRNNNTNRVVSSNGTNTQSATAANSRNNNLSTARNVQQNKNTSAQSYRGSYTNGGLKQEQNGQSKYNENVSLRNLISDSRADRRPSPEEAPNRKRQKLSDSSSACVKEASMPSNYDSMFNDDFEDDFDDFDDVPSSVIVNRSASNSKVISKPMVKNEPDTFEISVGENAGEKVKKLLSPLELNTQNSQERLVGRGMGKSVKKPLFSTSSKASIDDNVVNVPVKLESPSLVSIVCPSAVVNRRVSGGQVTLDKFVRTPPSRRMDNGSPIGQNGNAAKNCDGQKKLTDFPLVKTSYGIDAEPFTYLSIVKKQLTPQDSVTFKVKAYISTLIGRLDSSGGKEWTLACKINDGSDSLDVDLSSGVLTSLIGFSAPDSMVMKKRSKHDPSIKDVLVEGLQQCQQKLIELLCIMEIRVTPSKSRPEVVALHQMTPGRINALRTRVTQSLDNK
ncbi:recQ-mediated genome instability protein 1-like [Mizuhopecten yessoensis]|uniref:RecQ-mediated genome instability protein 1 n=1 Tax=Mizuhopecten yessoensis TaxID=6573 RepID=A0A210QXZ2_MIZYE|nr:recQ-mediated genome instability protein 1-like [Mizuhopecten yessoensis]OWF53628.1 RecQ-mediated genome instability protein 1 [Mizuhopecten yessoensis]